MIYFMLVLWFICGLPESWIKSSKQGLTCTMIKTREFAAHVWASYGKSGIY